MASSISSIRMGGLVSGLDTESIIKNLMKAEKAPLNKLLQKKQTEEWRRDQYRSMNSLLLDLRNTTSTMRLQSSYLKKVLTSGNDSVVSVKQTGNPSASSYNVNVKTLPSEAKAASVKFTAEQFDTIGQSFSFEINQDPNKPNDPLKTVSVAKDDTMASIVNKINALSATTGVTASYLKDDNSITFTSTKAGSMGKIQIGNIVDPKDDKGNSILPQDNKLKLSAGTLDNTTVIKDANGNITKNTSGFDLTKISVQTPQDGKSGDVEINGIPYSINSSTFTMDGVEFNIKATGTTQINLKPDQDAIFNSIKAYVDKYNDIIDKVNSKLSESVYRDYKPLLDEDKEALSEKQIEQWEDKAKSGLLRQDSLLTNVLSQMRLSISSNVTDDKGANLNVSTLSQIGITTGTYAEKGKLYIDENKLREAIAQNGNDVMDLFTKTSIEKTDLNKKFSQSGIAQRLYEQLTNTMSKLTEKSGSAASLTDNSIMGKMLTRINSDITSWQTRLDAIENRYWTKFTAMESAMSKASSQSSWLASQFS